MFELGWGGELLMTSSCCCVQVNLCLFEKVSESWVVLVLGLGLKGFGKGLE